MINVMQKYLSNKIKPNYPYYKFFILNTSKYTYEIIDIFKDVIGEAEVVSYESCSIIFYFNNIDFDFKSLIKTINDDFYTDAHLFESGKIQFGDATEFHKILDIYCIGEGNGNPLQCSCLENPRNGGACWAAVYGVAQSWTRLK